MKIGRRLAAAFAILLLLLVSVTTLGVEGMSEIQFSLKHIAQENNVELKAASAMRIAAFERALTVRNLHIALLTDAQAGEQSERAAKEKDTRLKKEAGRGKVARADFSMAQASLAGIRHSAKVQILLSTITELDRKTVPREEELFQALLANRGFDATFEIIKVTRNLLRLTMEACAELSALIEQQNAAAVADAAAAYQKARLLMLAVSAAALLVGALLAWLATRSITVPIAHAVRVARSVAAGDLGARIEVTSGDETGQLMQALQDMTQSLGQIVAEVRSGTQSITLASAEIAAGHCDLSSRTEQQASSLEETAASMEQLTSTVRQNSDNARQADGHVASAAAVARKGGEVAADVVRTMSAINDSARRIVDIIGVIDGIAFQTNILALNAAVEAARAGEQGRGFAVVASEVRNLAQRSAAAAREVKLLIGDSLTRVEAGNKLASQAGATMNEVAASVKRVTDIMREITAAGEEQRAGIEQVNRAITQIDLVTQQNAELVEKASAAASSMQQRAAGLTQAVSRFKLALR